MKTYTDLEQSKKLAEILPLESADMGWYYSQDPKAARVMMWCGTKAKGADIPCWSLAALLNVINKDFYPNLFHDGETWNLTATHHDDNTIKYDTCGDDPLDICYRMILFLHDKNLI